MRYYVRYVYVYSATLPLRSGECRSKSFEDYAEACKLQRELLRIANHFLDAGIFISYDLSIELDVGACNE